MTVIFSIVGIGMLLMAGAGALRGMEWSLSLGIAAIGVLILVGLGRPLYRVAVYRTGAHEILCRFVPWYQSTHLASLTFVIVGVSMLFQGREPGSPVWVRVAGAIALILGLLFVLSALLAWIANRLVITASTLSITIVFRQAQHIPRDNVQAIIPRFGRNGATGAPRTHVGVRYTPADSSSSSPVTIGQLEGQFTVDPANLLAALGAWKDGDPDDPGLLDRVEAILRRRSPHL